MPGATEPTVRSLLARRDLRLALVVDGDLDAALRWVHSSDLVDPTPFLSEGLALLTTGTQFAVDDPVSVYEAYVARLAARGVVALGFGTEVVRDGVPPQLAEAARGHRMTLFEVPYRTPFIAVARANAEAVAAEAYARRSWSLAAQRAISLAALRPDGLHASVSELARQLGAWVGLYDAAGRLSHEAGPRPTGATDAIEAQVTAVLRRRQGAGTTFPAGADLQVTLQTLGGGGHLRGVLAVSGARRDGEGRAVVTAVAAMASLALEQSGAVRRARGALRTAALRALLDGERTVAQRFAEEVGGLPRTVAAVAVVDAAAPTALAEWLEARPDRVFAGAVDEDLVLLLVDERVADEIAAEFAVPVGVSAPASLDAVTAALAQARTARRGRASGVGRFAASGVFTAAAWTPDAAVHAAALLAPLAGHDAAHGTDLVATVRIWLEEDARIDRAADRLGVHRHTVRSRVALAERVLERDLGTFPARAELWVALGLLGPDAARAAEPTARTPAAARTPGSAAP